MLICWMMHKLRELVDGEYNTNPCDKEAQRLSTITLDLIG
jgi:hypothetical protein